MDFYFWPTFGPTFWRSNKTTPEEVKVPFPLWRRYFLWGKKRCGSWSNRKHSGCKWSHKNRWVFPKIGGFPPKSSILIGFSIINHPFWGTTIFGNTQMLSLFVSEKRGVLQTFIWRSSAHPSQWICLQTLGHRNLWHDLPFHTWKIVCYRIWGKDIQIYESRAETHERFYMIEVHRHHRFEMFARKVPFEKCTRWRKVCGRSAKG